MILLAAGTPGWLFPQTETALNDYTEDLLHRENPAGTVNMLLEDLAEYHQQPIDLNSATREELAESGLFTPYQVEILLKYRNHFGPLFSLYELAGLSGFRGSQLSEITPYLTVRSPITASPDPRSLMMLCSINRTFPTASGFIPMDTLERAAFAGSPFKTGFRLKVTISGSLSAGLGYEKDPGEMYLHGAVPEFLSGFVQYRGTRQVQKLIMGSFRVQQGLGLVNGSQLINTVETYSALSPAAPKLIPYAGLGESQIERGTGCQLSFGRVGLMSWVSYSHMDLSLNQFREKPARVDWEEAARATGLHRTAPEVAGRSLAYRFHQGISVSFRDDHMILGAMVGWRINGLTNAGRDSLQLEGLVFRQATGSTYGVWSGQRITLSWELAMISNRSMAFLAGIKYRLNDFLKAVLLIHRYGKNYAGMIPSAYAAGSQIRNEYGASIGWFLETGRLFDTALKLELFRHPAPRYLTEVPSGSLRAMCTLKNSGIKDLQWRFRISRKQWQTTSDAARPGIRPLTDWKIIRSEIQFEYLPGRLLKPSGELDRGTSQIAVSSASRLKHEATLKWQSRIIFSWHQRSRINTPDYAVAQKITLSLPPVLQGVLQAAVFHVTTWENRIYLYEPGLLYSYNFPVCYGTGEMITGILSVRAGKRTTLSGKLTTTIYHDRETMGTGTELREGNRKWEVGMQLRVKL